MQIKETRFIKNQGFLTVLVMLAINENMNAWYTKDFDALTEKSVLEGIENGSLQPAMWEPCSVEDWTVGLDPRTPEQIQEANERQTAEMSAHIKKMLETIKPDLIEVFGDKTREKYIAAALTGLLASGSYHHDEASAVVGLATCYADAAILATQETTEA